MLGIRVVSWSYKKQSIVTLTITEVDFVDTKACACQTIWLRKILEELHLKPVEASTIFCDNSSTIKLPKNTMLHGTINPKHCKSEEVLADIFTKPLRVLSLIR